MLSSEIRKNIREYLKTDPNAGLLIDGLNDEASLIEAGIIDSMTALLLLCYLGEVYGIAPDAASIAPETFGSIASIERFVLECAPDLCLK